MKISTPLKVGFALKEIQTEQVPLPREKKTGNHKVGEVVSPH